MTCAVYARVSTDMQGESLENQVDYAQEYVRRLGEDYSLAKECVYTDFDQSGYYTRFVHRPAIQRALQDAAAKKYDVIVFKELSRISRDQAEHVEIISRFTQHGVRIIAINDNLDSERPETLDLLGIHSVMSEMESKRISSRVSSGKKSLARRGHWVGEAPIGYVLNPDTRRLEVDSKLHEIPVLIFHLFTTERFGTFKIAEYLNTRGLLTKYGRLWSRVTVNRVLRNPAYAGDLVYGRTRNTLKRIFDEAGYSKVQGRNAIPREEWVVVRDTHPPLVSREVFNAAQSIIAMRSKQNPRGARHPLTGLLRCGRCGEGMICQKQYYRGREYRYYCCSRAFRFGRAMCDQPNLNAQELELSILRFLVEQIRRFEQATVVLERKRKTTLHRVQKQERQLLRDLQKAQLGLERLLMDTDFPADTYTRLKETYVQSICEIEKQLRDLHDTAQGEASQVPTHVTVKDFLDELQQANSRSSNELRRVFHSVLCKMTVNGSCVTELELKYRMD